MFEIQYTLSAFNCLSRRLIGTCIFYHVKELGSLHNLEKISIWDIWAFHFISEGENGKKKNHVTTYIHEHMIFLKHMTIKDSNLNK